MFFELNRYGAKSFILEAKKILSIGFPMYLAMICLSGMGLVGSIITGQYHIDDLAAVSLANLLYFTFFLTISSFVVALNPMIAQLLGAGKQEKIGEVCRQGLLFALLIAFIAVILWLLLIYPVVQYLRHENYSPYIQNTVKYYLLISVFSLPASIMERTLQVYLTSVGKSKFIMLTAMFCLILYIPLAYILVSGAFGFGGLGGIGCAIAMLVIFWTLFFMLGMVVVRDKFFKPFQLFRQWSKPNLEIFTEIFKIGLPIVVSFFLEIGVFLVIVLVIVPLGKVYVASQEIVSQVANFLYMLPQSMGVATSVMVGYAIGKRKLVRARYSAGVGICLAAVGSIFTALLLIFFNQYIAAIFSKDTSVINLVSNVFLIVALFQFSDAVQLTAAGALRGYKITKIAMYSNFISYWIIGFGIGYYLGMVLGYHLQGFWIGMAIGITFSAVYLLTYLHLISKRFIRRLIRYTNY